jgi:hypothetical protein
VFCSCDSAVHGDAGCRESCTASSSLYGGTRIVSFTIKSEWPKVRFDLVKSNGRLRRKDTDIKASDSLS